MSYDCKAEMDVFNMVSESRIQEIERVFSMRSIKELNRLSVMEDINSLLKSKYYSNKSFISTDCDTAIKDDKDEVVDRGYLRFFDKIKDRYIYVAPHDVALSLAFHVEMNLSGVCNVVKPNANHEDFSDMTKGMQLKFLRNFRLVLLYISHILYMLCC